MPYILPIFRVDIFLRLQMVKFYFKERFCLKEDFANFLEVVVSQMNQPTNQIDS